MIYTYNGIKFNTKNIEGESKDLFTIKNYFVDECDMDLYRVSCGYEKESAIAFGVNQTGFCCGLDEIGDFTIDKKATPEEIAFLLDQYVRVTEGIACFFTVSLQESSSTLVKSTKFLRRFKKVTQFLNKRTGHTIITFHSK